jgi:hypothetical protein
MSDSSDEPESFERYRAQFMPPIIDALGPGHEHIAEQVSDRLAQTMEAFYRTLLDMNLTRAEIFAAAAHTMGVYLGHILALMKGVRFAGGSVIDWGCRKQ